jgi:hypothetical protein
MQTEPHRQERTLSRFLQLSRLHFGLIQAPAAVSPPRRIAGSTRQMLRSLVVAGSLGALLGSPAAFAGETSRPAEPGKRNQNTHSPRLKANDLPAHAHRQPIPGKHR